MPLAKAQMYDQFNLKKKQSHNTMVAAIKLVHHIKSYVSKINL